MNPFDISAVGGKPLHGFNYLRGQFDAPFVDIEALVINLAFAGDDIEEATGNIRRSYGAVSFHPLFEAAQATALAEIFPFFKRKLFRRFPRP